MTEGRSKGAPVVFLMGPTTSGKTKLAAHLFDEFDVELVNVDAAQIYRGLDIGTAKPDTKFLQEYPHHLIDICDPGETYCAAQFRLHALDLIAQIHARKKIPLLVGGTIFYFFALENGLSDLPSANPEVRATIANEMEVYGLAAMHARLEQIDPELANTIQPSDPQRIQRAFEIYYLTAKPPSHIMNTSTKHSLSFPLIKLGLCMLDRSELHARIEKRFEKMLESGLVDEVSGIVSRLENPNKEPCMRIIGYRQVFHYLRKECTYNEMIEKGMAATRQLAKRQLTWMRRQRNLTWVDADHPMVAENVSRYLRKQLMFMRQKCR